DFARAPVTTARIDEIGEFGAPEGKFFDWMRSMLRWSNNAAASNCILALGYPYIDGALVGAGFFDEPAQNGLWVSGDYGDHDWVATELARRANAGGWPLHPDWQRKPGH